MWSVRELRSSIEILSRLQEERLYAAYAIGDLEPYLFAQCRWWLAEQVAECGGQSLALSHRGTWALVLLFGGLDPPALFCIGEPAGVTAILDWAPLPACVYLTARPTHWPDVEKRYHLRFANPMWRMVLDAARFRPVEGLPVVRLAPPDEDRLQELYEYARGCDVDGYAPIQLEQGVFYGLEAGRHLVSVAGTHLVAPSYGLAALGNVFTHPGHRGRGYATICTSAVTSELVEQGLEVVLNVAEANERAVALYRRLGYRFYCHFVEGIGQAITPFP
jgi:GNAT superfamily N-acetyltransferase